MPLPLRIAVLAVVFPLLVGLVHFSAAGTVNLPAVWAILAALALLFPTMALLVGPSLMRERLAPGPGNQDRFTPAVTMALFFIQWVLAGLDVGRLHLSPLPESVRWAGVGLYVLCLALILWAVRSNPFYSSAVRIQTDRGHHLVTAGPYRIVRHPGYTGSILGMIAGSLAFGSGIGMAPAVLAAVLFIRRTALEDRMLRDQLPGYADYAHRTRYRLLPGIY